MITLTINQFITIANTAIILDLRHQDDFVKSFIPNSLFIGIDGPFEKWIQLLVADKNTAIVFVAPLGRENEAYEKIISLGYSNVLGCLKGGFTTWLNSSNAKSTIDYVSAIDFNKVYKTKEICNVVDVRKIDEFETACLKKSSFLPLAFTSQFIEGCVFNRPFFLFCGGGYRSVIAISYLKKHHIHNGINVLGGFKAINK